MQKFFIDQVVNQLCREDNLKNMVHFGRCDMCMPSVEILSQIMELIRSVIFPGFFGESDISPDNIKYYTGSKLDKIKVLMSEQIKRGYCYSCKLLKNTDYNFYEIEKKSMEITCLFLEQFPKIRALLAMDIDAAFDGDPAVNNKTEIIFCYPGIKCMTYYRIAHELFKFGIPLIPRIISEMGHSETGIDIHPQAQIGSRFFIDHGTGIVIGGTCIIGNNVRIYQGVTLGAKSFPCDEHGHPIKGIPRHPIVEDNVIIYSGATILGRITIGKNSVIGGNTWITQDIPAHSKVFRSSKT